MNEPSSVDDESESSGTNNWGEESTCYGKDFLFLFGEHLEFIYDTKGIHPRLGILRRLEAFMNAWSSAPSADRGRPRRLYMNELYITAPLITRLVPLLVHQQGSFSSVIHDNDHDRVEHSLGTCTGTTSTGSEVPTPIFHTVEIESCRFCSQASLAWGFENEDACTPHDKNCFLSALAQFPGLLKIDDSKQHTRRGDRGASGILSTLLRIAEIDHFKVTGLHITDFHQHVILSDLEYIKLGAMIQANAQLTDLVLGLQFRPQGVPQEFLDHLANSVHLRSLSLDFYAFPWGDQDEDNQDADNLNAGDQDRQLRNAADMFNADFRDPDLRDADDLDEDDQDDDDQDANDQDDDDQDADDQEDDDEDDDDQDDDDQEDDDQEDDDEDDDDQDDDDQDEDDEDEDDQDDDDQDEDDHDVHDHRGWDQRIRFGEETFGIVERLLRNPQSQLIKLALDGYSQLEDHHLIALAHLLPTSNIRTLHLIPYYCRVQSLLEFARQFPNMLSLNSIYLEAGHALRKNEINEQIKECGDFFLQGLIENPSITRFNMYRYFPQRPLMVHYLSLNRAGRKLLSPSQEQRIPDGLWPLVLERAGASGNRDGPYFIRDRDGSSPWAYVDHGPVNAVFFFLQNCPKLLSYATGTGG